MECYVKISKRERFAFISMYHVASLLRKYYFVDYFGHPLFDVGSEKFLMLPAAIYLRRGTQFTKTFGKIITTFFEAGLTLKLEMNAAYHIHDIFETSLMVIDMKNLVGSFGLLLIGLGFAFIIFTGETTAQWFRKCTKIGE